MRPSLSACRPVCVYLRTLVSRSYVSLNCRCFPALLARSSHFPFSHFTVGFLVRVVESTFAVITTSAPANHTPALASTNHQPITGKYNRHCAFLCLLVLCLSPVCPPVCPTCDDDNILLRALDEEPGQLRPLAL